MVNTVIESVVVAGGMAVIANETGTYRLLDLKKFGGWWPFPESMTGLGSPASTAALLKGVITLGLGRDPATLKKCASTLPAYVLDLVGSYHNAGRTVGNYLKAAARFRQLDRADIAAYLERHAREENGHERLALKDLAALGLPAERLVTKLCPREVATMCELFDSLSSADYPIGCIGYSYFFESSAATRQKSDIDSLEALCPTGVDATRFMRAHSSLASEADHVTDMIAFIANLPADDRTAIALAAYETAVTLRQAADPKGPKDDEALWQVIRRAAGEETGVAA